MQVQKSRIFYALFRELGYNNRLAYIFIGILTITVGVIEFPEVYTHEDIYNGYNHFVSQTIEPNCSWSHLPYQRGGINWYIVCASYMTFDNSRVIPFFISMSLIPVTWLFVRTYSNNIVAISTTIGLVLNPVFLIFDSSSAYAQTWTLFFISSLYLFKKNSILGLVTYNTAMFCKAIPFAWAPFLAFVLIKSKPQKPSRWLIGAGLGVPSLFVITLSIFDGGTQAYGMFIPKPISYQSLVDAVTWIFVAYRWNEELLVATPILLAIYLLKKNSWNIPKFPFQLLVISWLAFFGITLLTVEGYFPYRIIPNITMFLFAASTLLYGYVSKNVFKQSESLKR